MVTFKVKTGDSIAIGDTIIVVKHVRGKDQLRLSIEAPIDVRISHARAGGLLANSEAAHDEVLPD